MTHEYHYNPGQIAELFGLRGGYGHEPRFNGTELIACCPFKHFKSGRGHYYESRPSFAVNMFTGAYNCMSCGQSGLNLESLAFKLDVDLPPTFRTDVSAPSRQDDDLKVGNHYLKIVTANSEAAASYLAGRGICAGTAESFQVGADDTGEIIYLPIFDTGKVFLGWLERRINALPRWKLRPGYVHTTALFGLDKAVERSRSIILVESSMDVLMLHQYGYTAVATCGAKVYPEQIEIILDHFDSLHLIPHNDMAGYKWAEALVFGTYSRCRLYGTHLPDMYKDIGDVIEGSEIHRLLSSPRLIKGLPPARKKSSHSRRK